MSRENLEIAVRGLQATCAPTPDVETMNEVYAPDHVLVSAIGEENVGMDGYEAWDRALQEATPPEFTIEGAVDLGLDLVLAVVAVRIRGSASGMTLDQRHWTVMRLSGGKIARTESYVSPAAALKAMGFSE